MNILSLASRYRYEGGSGDGVPVLLKFGMVLLLVSCLTAPCVGAGQPSRVMLDEQQRMAVNDELFFPLGIYIGPNSDEHLTRIAEAGFNFVVCYGFGRNLNTEEVVAYMDRAELAGLKVFYSLKDHYRHARGFPQDEYRNGPLLAQTVHVPLLKDHPALLGWYINDEMYPSPHRIEQAQAMYDTVKACDPCHPVLAVINRPYKAAVYRSNTDIIAPDPYPVPNYPLTKVCDWLDLTRAGVGDDRALWAVTQIFAWGVYGVRNDPADVYRREPTYAEMRCMHYLALIERAQGLLLYSYMDLWRRPGRQNEDEMLFQRRWAQIVPLAREFQQLGAVLLEAVDVELTVRPFYSVVRRRVVEHDGKLYVMAANTSADNKTQQIWVELPEGDWDVERVLEGDAITEFDEQGRLVVYLAPYGADTVMLQPKQAQ